MILGIAVLYWRWWFALIPLAGVPFVTRGMMSQRDWLYPRVVDFDGFTMLGHGVGWFAERFSLVYPHSRYTFGQEHSVVLSVYTLMGMVGLCLLGWLLCKVQWRRDAWAAAFAAFMVNSVCNISWNMASLAVFGILFYSVVSNIKER
jgi:hypothetical protein